jgi:hypothetical protein
VHGAGIALQRDELGTGIWAMVQYSRRITGVSYVVQSQWAQRTASATYRTLARICSVAHLKKRGPNPEER